MLVVEFEDIPVIVARRVVGVSSRSPAPLTCAESPVVKLEDEVVATVPASRGAVENSMLAPAR